MLVTDIVKKNLQSVFEDLADVEKCVWEGDPFSWTSSSALATINTERGLPCYPYEGAELWENFFQKMRDDGYHVEPVNSAIMAVYSNG